MGLFLNRMRHAFHLFDSLIQAKVENTPKSKVNKKDDRDVQIFSQEEVEYDVKNIH